MENDESALSPQRVRAWQNCDSYKVSELVCFAMGEDPIPPEFMVNRRESLFNSLVKRARRILVDGNSEPSKSLPLLNSEENFLLFCRTELCRQDAIILLDKLVGTPHFLSDNQLPPLLDIDKDSFWCTEDFERVIQIFRDLTDIYPEGEEGLTPKQLVLEYLEEKYGKKLSGEYKKLVAKLLSGGRTKKIKKLKK
jgi:hypothetical protein